MNRARCEGCGRKRPVDVNGLCRDCRRSSVGAARRVPSFKVGQRVRHFTNRGDRNAILGTVVAVQPAHDCGEFGMGNWLRGAFMAVDAILVAWPSGAKEWEFASSYEAATL